MQSLQLGQAPVTAISSIFEVSASAWGRWLARYAARLVLFAALYLAWPLPIVQAAFVTTGDVQPSNPATWTSSTTASIGGTANGTLTVDNGSDLLSQDAYLAAQSAQSGSIGQVTVDGPGSTWTNGRDIKVGYAGSGTGILNVLNGGAVSDSSGFIGGYFARPTSGTGVATVSGTNSAWTHNSELFVGYSGSGTLNINNGGTVSSVGTTYVSYTPGAIGTINFGGGTLVAKTLAASTSDLTGTGTINTCGLVSDAALVFNSTASLNRAITFNQQGQNLNVNLDVRSGSGDLGAGWKGNGSIGVQNGVKVNSYYGVLGYHSSSTGTATVTDSGSKWNSSTLYVGCYGKGVLDVIDGGIVSSDTSYIGEYSGSTGAVTVRGAGSKWINDADFYVGYDGDGTLNVAGGAVEAGGLGCIGYHSGSTGVATVDGAIATWSNQYLAIGYDGNGTLNIANGGIVTSTSWTQVGRNGPGSTGTINFGPGGGTLTTQALYVSPLQLAGTGTINTKGLVSDIDIVLDSPASLRRTLTFNSQPGQNVTVNLDLTDSQSMLGAGWRGNGSLTIRNGLAVSSSGSCLGYSFGSRGVATVTGVGSEWIVNGINVGSQGSGMLNITNGGVVNCSSTCAIGQLSSGSGVAIVAGAGSEWNSDMLWIGDGGKGTLQITEGGAVNVTQSSSLGLFSGSVGVATVDGVDSTWSNGYRLIIGSSGNGTLNISGGGVVTAANRITIKSQSLLAIDIGNNSSVSVGNGTFWNNGSVRIVSGAEPAAHSTFVPISAATWSGTGTYRAVGGTWNAGTHVFTVSDVVSGTSGQQVAIDLATTQRILVNDVGEGHTGWSVGASFLAASSSKPLTFTTTVMDDPTLNALESLLAPNQSVLGAWDFSASAGYTPGDPAYLSFGIPAGYSRNDLQIWHYSGASWTEYAATDLTCNGTYASFTVTGFSGYAVTEEVLLPGDANLDGTTDATDLNTVLSFYNQIGTDWSKGDFNYDGKTDATDLNSVLSFYNRSLLGTGGSMQMGSLQGSTYLVPEPSSIIMLTTLSALMSVLIMGRRE